MGKVLYPAILLAAVAVLVLPLFRSPDHRSQTGPGTDRDLAEEYGLPGKAVLIEFGTIGCELSEEGLTAMIRLQAEKRIPDLSYMRVELVADQGESDEYYSKKTPGFPVRHDPEMKMAGAFDATIIPSFVLVDRFGNVRYRGGQPLEEHLMAWVDALNAEKTDPGSDVPLFGARELDIPGLLATTELPVFGGNTRKRLEEYMGRNGLLVTFVDTLCPLAAQIIGELPDHVSILAEQGIAVVLVNVNNSEEAVRDYFGDRELSTPILYDVSSGTHSKWDIFGVPRFFLISSDRRLIYGGVTLWQEMAKAAEQGLGLAAGSLELPHAGTEYG